MAAAEEGSVPKSNTESSSSMAGTASPLPRVESLDETVRRRQEAKYDHALEGVLRAWMEEVLGSEAPSRDISLHEALKSGVVLCKLANKLKPGSVKRINKTKLAFHQLDNITKYLDVCQQLGIAPNELFRSTDLYEGKDMNSVLTSLHLLATRAPRMPGYAGAMTKMQQAPDSPIRARRKKVVIRSRRAPSPLERRSSANLFVPVLSDADRSESPARSSPLRSNSSSKVAQHVTAIESKDQITRARPRTPVEVESTPAQAQVAPESGVSEQRSAGVGQETGDRDSKQESERDGEAASVPDVGHESEADSGMRIDAEAEGEHGAGRQQAGDRAGNGEAAQGGTGEQAAKGSDGDGNESRDKSMGRGEGGECSNAGTAGTGSSDRMRLLLPLEACKDRCTEERVQESQEGEKEHDAEVCLEEGNEDKEEEKVDVREYARNENAKVEDVEEDNAKQTTQRHGVDGELSARVQGGDSNASEIIGEGADVRLKVQVEETTAAACEGGDEAQQGKVAAEELRGQRNTVEREETTWDDWLSAAVSAGADMVQTLSFEIVDHDDVPQLTEEEMARLQQQEDARLRKQLEAIAEAKRDREREEAARKLREAAPEQEAQVDVGEMFTEFVGSVWSWIGAETATQPEKEKPPEVKLIRQPSRLRRTFEQHFECALGNVVTEALEMMSVDHYDRLSEVQVQLIQTVPLDEVKHMNDMQQQMYTLIDKPGSSHSSAPRFDCVHLSTRAQEHVSSLEGKKEEVSKRVRTLLENVYFESTTSRDAIQRANQLYLEARCEATEVLAQVTSFAAEMILRVAEGWLISGADLKDDEQHLQQAVFLQQLHSFMTNFVASTAAMFAHVFRSIAVASKQALEGLSTSHTRAELFRAVENMATTHRETVEADTAKALHIMDQCKEWAMPVVIWLFVGTVRQRYAGELASEGLDGARDSAHTVVIRRGSDGVLNV